MGGTHRPGGHAKKVSLQPWVQVVAAHWGTAVSCWALHAGVRLWNGEGCNLVSGVPPRPPAFTAKHPVKPGAKRSCHAAVSELGTVPSPEVNVSFLFSFVKRYGRFVPWEQFWAAFQTPPSSRRELGRIVSGMSGADSRASVFGALTRAAGCQRRAFYGTFEEHSGKTSGKMFIGSGLSPHPSRRVLSLHIRRQCN